MPFSLFRSIYCRYHIVFNSCLCLFSAYPPHYCNVNIVLSFPCHQQIFLFTPCWAVFFCCMIPISDLSHDRVQMNNKCDFQLSEPFIIRKHFQSGLDSLMCLWTWAPKNNEFRATECQLQVGFEELAQSFRQHLTSFTNKWSPHCFKVRLISFWDSAQNTGILNIEKGASLHGNPQRARPSPHPILHWSDIETETRWSFSTSSIFTHSSWILAANSRLYYWMDVLLCHSEECLKWNFKLE